MMSKRQDGFTLIELMLAIAFLGGLVLLSTLTVVQSLAVYNKGVAIKQIDQVGRALIEDINRLSSSGATDNLQLAANGRAGFLCINPSGSTNVRAYIWSPVTGDGVTTGKFVTSDTPAAPVALSKTNDGVDGAGFCALPSFTSNKTVPNGDATTLLNDQIRILSVDISSDPANPDQPLKNVVFWIGTHGSVPGMTPVFDAGKWTCKGGNLGNFCAFGRFETTIYTPNEE